MDFVICNYDESYRELGVSWVNVTASSKKAREFFTDKFGVDCMSIDIRKEETPVFIKRLSEQGFQCDVMK